MSRSEDRVLVHRDGRGVVTLSLNRPDRNNAYDAELLMAAHAALDTLQPPEQPATDPSAPDHGASRIHPPHLPHPAPRVLVIRGEGAHFQAGADLRWLEAVSRQSAQANLEASTLTASLMRRLQALPLPVVALVQGGCFGGGTGLIASCDVVVAADNAQFSIAESRWGMIASIIIPQLNDAMSVRQVRRYALTGERFDAQTAYRVGLVHEVVPLSALEDAGERVIAALLLNGPQATAQTKATVLRSCWSGLTETQYQQLVHDHALKRQSSEAAEGLASFMEKRLAAWAPGGPKR